MTPTDVDLVNLAAAIYKSDDFDYLDKGADDGVYWGLKKLDGCDVVVLRGSVALLDWLRDLRAFGVPTRIGTVHEGFHAGMEKMWSELQMMTTQPVLVTGHSLGAARADVLCGLMLADGKPPIRRVVFGEPRPGMPDFCETVSKIPGASYCNSDHVGHDWVTDVPLKLGGQFNFSRPTPRIYVTAPPAVWDRLIDPPFDYHHIELYQAAMEHR